MGYTDLGVLASARWRGADTGPVKNGDVVQRVNKILVGWGNYFQCGYPKRAFDKVNWYVRNRLYLHFNRKSQRGYVLKYAPNFYRELQAMGLHRLQWRQK